jgi:hypothetical protein
MRPVRIPVNLLSVAAHERTVRDYQVAVMQ